MIETKDSIEIDLREIRKQISGINPKLSLYKKLKEKEEMLKAKLGYGLPDPYKRCKTEGCKKLGKSRGGYKCPDTGRNIPKRGDYCEKHTAENRELNTNPNQKKS